jgi:uncharacterized protein with FMN-binding domain
MRRVLVALLGAACGTALLIGAKAYVAPADSSIVADGTPDPFAGGPDLAGDPSASNSPTAQPGAPESTSPVATTTSAPAGSAPTKPATLTIVGTAFAAKGYGSVQVQVVMTGAHLDDVQVLKMSNRPLNAPAKLRQEALTKQSAQLTNVSGATYTSQSALSKA